MNYIHETALVEKGVILGDENYIGPFCIIKSGTIIGNNNRFEAYVSIGTAPEHRDFLNGRNERYKPVLIGDNNVFREFVTINAGVSNQTIIKNFCTFLKSSHVGHDCIVHDWVTLSCGCLIGGHTIIMEGANFGLGSICHQKSIIGAYAMIGMHATITKSLEVTPGDIFVGSPAKFLKRNQIGLDRGGVTPERLTKLYNDWFDLTIK